MMLERVNTIAHSLFPTELMTFRAALSSDNLPTRQPTSQPANSLNHDDDDDDDNFMTLYFMASYLLYFLFYGKMHIHLFVFV